MPKSIVIAGPTNSGKTSYALKLAKALDAEILSADSRQIYKFMDIGTGKLPLQFSGSMKKADKVWEIDGIKVWGYDVVKPNEYFSAYDFVKFASTINFKSKIVLIVGGTGFYIDALCGDVTLSNVPPNPVLRDELSKLRTEELFAKLESLDKKTSERIDKFNKVRLIRALEILLSKKSENLNLKPITPVVKFLFSPDRVELYKRADVWIKEVFENGLVAETDKLMKAGFSGTQPINGLIYKSSKALIRGELDLPSAIQRASFDLHAYIRRQETYFKKMTGYNYVDSLKDGFDTSLTTLVQSKLG